MEPIKFIIRVQVDAMDPPCFAILLAVLGTTYIIIAFYFPSRLCSNHILQVACLSSSAALQSAHCDLNEGSEMTHCDILDRPPYVGAAKYLKHTTAEDLHLIFERDLEILQVYNVY